MVPRSTRPVTTVPRPRKTKILEKKIEQQKNNNEATFDLKNGFDGHAKVGVNETLWKRDILVTLFHELHNRGLAC
jgi:hypothetical protein